MSAPTRLRLPDLLQETDRYADDVLSGRYEHLMPVGGPPSGDRWFVRLHGDDELDVWLISWVPDRSTESHDHGGSLGALTVVSGALRETRWDGEALRCRRLRASDQAGFPLGWVHDVVWTPERDLSAPVIPTLSVHAYSPPLTAMSYYEVTERNALRRKDTELVPKRGNESNRSGAQDVQRRETPGIASRQTPQATDPRSMTGNHAY